MSTIIVGSIETYIADVMKGYALPPNEDRVHIVPHVLSITPHAPTKSRKYVQIDMKFSLPADTFTVNAVQAFLMGDFAFSMKFLLPPTLLTEDTLKDAEKSNESFRELFRVQPELGRLFVNFLSDWKAVYERVRNGETVPAQEGYTYGRFVVKDIEEEDVPAMAHFGAHAGKYDPETKELEIFATREVAAELRNEGWLE